jgi:hypothetical protein
MTMFPKPKDKRLRRSPVRVMPDGREICNRHSVMGRTEYRSRVNAMWQRQDGMCGLRLSPRCPGAITIHQATFEHVDGRGHGGGHRDDRIEKDGKPYNCAACIWCNSEKGSRRL